MSAFLINVKHFSLNGGDKKGLSITGKPLKFPTRSLVPISLAVVLARAATIFLVLISEAFVIQISPYKVSLFTILKCAGLDMTTPYKQVPLFLCLCM
jgi:hypothetical protein